MPPFGQAGKNFYTKKLVTLQVFVYFCQPFESEMKRITILLALSLTVCFQAFAQKDISTEATSVVMFGARYSFQIPGADTKQLYGVNSTIGGVFTFKTAGNWLFQMGADYIFGNRLKISRNDLFSNISTSSGEIITGDGIFATMALFERGWNIQGKVGKVIPVLSPNPNCGFFVNAGFGYLTNHIRIETSSYESPPPQIAGDYAKGYDRMRGGPAFSAELGYMYLSNDRIKNAALSFEFVQAKTKSLRDYDFVLMGHDDKVYIDRYFGIKLTVFIPTYKRKPQEYYYY